MKFWQNDSSTYFTEHFLAQIDDMADSALAVKPDEIQTDLVDMLVNSIIFNPEAERPSYDSPLLFVLMHELVYFSSNTFVQLITIYLPVDSSD